MSLRVTIASRNPCSSRNSARWNPSGSFCRVVCSITRGPAKPISAPGSAIFRSPSIAKHAVTPPKVGSVATEMYGMRSSASRARPEAILASCINETTPPLFPEATLSDRVDDRVVQPGLPAPLRQPMLVLLQVRKIQRVRRAELQVHQFVARRQQQRNPPPRIDAEVVAAIRADVQILFQVLLEDCLPATAALCPQAFGAHRLLPVVGNLVVFPLEPGHAQSFLGVRRIRSIVSGAGRFWTDCSQSRLLLRKNAKYIDVGMTF